MEIFVVLWGEDGFFDHIRYVSGPAGAKWGTKHAGDS